MRRKMFDGIIIGAGCAGAVVARKLAEKNKKVLVIEQRSHVGGNCYDEKDSQGILVHKYGPHIFHTNEKKVYDFLSEFTKWYEYRHEVVGNVHGKFLPIPFNLNTLKMVYGEEKGKRLEEELIKAYGKDARVPILELKNNPLGEIQDIAEFVYENIFLKYTMKQWGQTPEQIDPSVTARVPVLLSYDNRYFQDTYQGMPFNGYTKMFEHMLNHKNITIKLETCAKEVISVKEGEAVYFEGQEFRGPVIYTGALDELFDCRFGRLPYRSLDFVFEQYKKPFYQTHGVVNYTVSEDYTRITEFKYLTGQEDEVPDCTTIMKEYPKVYTGEQGQIPYYAIMNKENNQLYETYVSLVDGIPNFHLLGRLAEYKYYNIDAIVAKALEIGELL